MLSGFFLNFVINRKSHLYSWHTLAQGRVQFSSYNPVSPPSLQPEWHPHKVNALNNVVIPCSNSRAHQHTQSVLRASVVFATECFK